MVSYPDYPESKILFDTRVRAVSESEWVTHIAVTGRYDGPTDIESVTDYQIVWTSDGETLFETGGATLMVASGGCLRSRWSSSIKPGPAILRGFPSAGLIVNARFLGFEIGKKSLSYSWEGHVSKVGNVMFDQR